jgi:hypothetical protein
MFEDSAYAYAFNAYSGDWYIGYLYADTGTYAVGESIGTPYGNYVITDEVAYGFDLGAAYGPAFEEGTVFISSYFDSASGAVSTPFYYASGVAAGTNGLASEVDYVFDGIQYDPVGHAGAYQADPPGFDGSPAPDSGYAFVFRAYSGDAYFGYTHADTGTYAVGQTFATAYGDYTITDEVAYGYDLSSVHGSAVEDGRVYLSSYFDQETGLSYTPIYYAQGYGSGDGGLGNELDWVSDGFQVEPFGFGGQVQVNV